MRSASCPDSCNRAVGIKELASGENAPLPADWRLTVGPPSVPLVIIQLDATGRIHGDPISVAATALAMDLGALDLAVHRCLLVAHGQQLPPTTVELDLGGDTVLRFRSGSHGEAGAAVLVEFYRRNGAWKVRALGHRYAGGLAELGGVHGAEPTASGDSPTSATGRPDFGDPAVVLRHLNGIWEDAARSLIAYAESLSFAEERRDAEQGELLGDLAARGPEYPGIFRIGTLTRTDSLALKIPLVHGISAVDGIYLENPAAIVDEASMSLLHRVLAALPTGAGVTVVADDELSAALDRPACRACWCWTCTRPHPDRRRLRHWTPSASTGRCSGCPWCTWAAVRSGAPAVCGSSPGTCRWSLRRSPIPGPAWCGISRRTTGRSTLSSAAGSGDGVVLSADRVNIQYADSGGYDDLEAPLTDRP